MWICLKNSFLSIVSDNSNPDLLLVRARRGGDIEAVFPDAKVKENAGTDYKYRVSIDRRAVASAIADVALNIDYNNFKNSVEDQERHDAYLDVWNVLYRFQLAKVESSPSVEEIKGGSRFSSETESSDWS